MTSVLIARHTVRDALGINGSLGGATTLVGIGREQVQIVLLSLPPAPLEELPELVRFQAERSFTSLGNDAALDYIPLEGDAATPHQVLAAALSAGGEVCSGGAAHGRRDHGLRH